MMDARAPAMMRAHSMPNPNTSLRLPDAALSASHGRMRSPARARSPRTRPEDPSSLPPRSPSWPDAPGGGAVQTIEEDEELDLASPKSLTSPLPPSTAAFSRSNSLRRRHTSPLQATANSPPPREPSLLAPASDPSASLTTSTGSSTASSPALGPQRFNETYPSLHYYSSTSSFSSISSTPTSTRSRSPSISSLDTIEDAPDLESEATEMMRIESLKLAAERAETSKGDEGSDGEGGGVRRRSSLDVPRGFRGPMSRERKRWSICGGERRADLDLETIWED